MNTTSTRSTPRRTLCAALMLSILLSLTGCAPAEIPAEPEPSPFLVIDLAKELADGRNEFPNAPWYGAIDDTVAGLGLAAEAINIQLRNEDWLELSAPVYILPFEKRATMVLRFALEPTLNDGEGALIGLGFSTFVADSAEYETFLTTFAHLADREANPFPIDEAKIAHTAASGRPFPTVSGHEFTCEEHAARCAYYLSAQATRMEPLPSLDRALNQAYCAQISLHASQYKRLGLP